MEGNTVQFDFQFTVNQGSGHNQIGICYEKEEKTKFLQIHSVNMVSLEFWPFC